jgi:putative aldouronate transport system substrate-binding protein
MEKTPALKTLNTAPDGNIYGLGAYTECFHCSYPNKMWINTEWLKKLNLEEPKTTEEFKQMLEAFKTQDPNGNGKADEVPLSGSTEDFGVRIIPYLMNSFVYDDDRNYLNLTPDGKVESAAIKPEWKEGLTYIKSLFDAGLIDPGAFTQNAEAFKKIGENADAEILGAGAGMHPAIFITLILATHVQRITTRLLRLPVLPESHLLPMMQAVYRREPSLSLPTKPVKKHRLL